MSEEDLQQIRAVVAGAIAESEARMKAAIAESETRLAAKQDGAMEVVAGEFSQVRQEIAELRQDMDRGFNRMDQRFNTVERRLERVEYQTIGMSKSLTDAEQLDTATAAALSAQQRAADDLFRQLNEIKRQQHPPQQ